MGTSCLRSSPHADPPNSHSKPLPLTATTMVSSAEPIYDFQFYPFFSFSDPNSAVYLTSSRDHPVHLRDAYTGSVRCSYQTYDHLDQVVGPYSVCFTPDGGRIYCGLENSVQVFDTARPGNQGQTIYTTPTRKSKEGQKGIISTIAFCPDGSGLWAAGSYSRTIGLYDERQEGVLFLLADGNVDIDRVRFAERPGRTKPTRYREGMGGVTQISFSPDGLYLFSASRKDNLMLCWDIRNSDEVLCAFDRGPSDTNQRMLFDVDVGGKWLVAGDTEGYVSAFQLGVGEGDTGTHKSWKLHGGKFFCSS